MKLVLSVWYAYYKRDLETTHVPGLPDEPDLLTIEPMRQLFRRRVYGERWDALGSVTSMISRGRGNSAWSAPRAF